jgi:hypothetical protein
MRVRRSILIATGTTQTRRTGDFTEPGLDKLLKCAVYSPDGRSLATGGSFKIAVLSQDHP